MKKKKANNIWYRQGKLENGRREEAESVVPQGQEDGKYGSAVAIVNLLLRYYEPHTVIEIGCGEGTWLEVFGKAGAVVTGIDSEVDLPSLRVTPKCIVQADIENEHITCDNKFELAMSLETANRLSEKRADSFVRELAALSDVVMFSAAIPGQDGAPQQNAQYQSYWAEKFSQEGFRAIDCIRPFIWKTQGMLVPYAQNILLYVREEQFAMYPLLVDYCMKNKDIIYDLVHPAAWEKRDKI